MKCRRECSCSLVGVNGEDDCAALRVSHDLPESIRHGIGYRSATLRVGVTSIQFVSVPRHSHVDDRAEEEEHNKLRDPALHESILYHTIPSPAALGATDRVVVAQVEATFLTVSRRKSPVMSECQDRRRCNNQ